MVRKEDLPGLWSGFAAGSLTIPVCLSAVSFDQNPKDVISFLPIRHVHNEVKAQKYPVTFSWLPHRCSEWNAIARALRVTAEQERHWWFSYLVNYLILFLMRVLILD